MQMAEAMNITAAITLYHDETPEDLADFVEYMYGASSSIWGAKRVSDGHAKKYSTDKYFEIGNEIDTPNWGEKAAAMEAAAVKHGVGKKLRYAAPMQVGAHTNQKGWAGGKVGAQGYLDIHDGNGLFPAGQIEAYLRDFQAGGGYDTRFAIWETNTAQLHDFHRALMEAGDLASLDRDAPRLRIDSRTASFCSEKSGHVDLWEKGHGDQGLVFFTQNVTWLQPPAWVHSMVAKTWQPNQLNSTASSPLLDVTAASADGSVALSVRVTNTGNIDVTATVAISGKHLGEVTVVTLVAPGGNTSAVNPWQDTKYIAALFTACHVSPHNSRPQTDTCRHRLDLYRYIVPSAPKTVAWSKGSTFVFAAQSYTTLAFSSLK